MTPRVEGGGQGSACRLLRPRVLLTGGIGAKVFRHPDLQSSKLSEKRRLLSPCQATEIYLVLSDCTHLDNLKSR